MLGDGTARCWGDNTWGQMGNGSTSGLPEGSPVQVMRRTGVVASGEFGNGSLPTANPWAATANVRDRHNPFRLASGGANHGTSCVIESNGSYVFCWGQGTAGQLGNGATASANIPVAVSVISGVTAIALGNAHACAFLSNGEVRCWGAGGFGQIGDNTILDAGTPQRVALAFQQSVVALGSGPAADHTCFLDADESAWCWGRASQGQLGDGVGYASYLQPVPVQVIGF